MKKLLIVGAGEHGRVVYEIAKAVGYQECYFADDNNALAVGKCSDLSLLREKYDEGIVAIGNNCVRERMQQELKRCGYDIPILIHPTAYVSPTAELASGTVVEPMAVINTNTIVGEGVIIGASVVVDHDASVEKYSHVNAGAIVKAFGRVDAFEKVESGIVIQDIRDITVNVDKDSK